MVTDRYQHLRHHDDVGSFAGWAAASSLPVVGVDNLPGSVPLESTRLPRACVLLLGQEGPGLSPAAREAVSLVVSVAQFGSTRSINAGAAAAVAMHTWVRQHVTGHPL
jgi:tRNA G18 (ribose-2'-O)-methylase SpoU